MKNNYATKGNRLRSIAFKKTFFQKMCCLLLVTLCILQAPVQAKDTVANVPVSVSVSNESVRKVLTVVEEQTGLKFFYLNKQVNTKRKVTLHFVRTPLHTVLDQLFRNSNVTYTISGRNIVLKARSMTETSSRNDGNDDLPDAGSEVSTEVVGNRMESSVAITVSGVVTGDASEPLPGVSVIVKGTKNGTTTDADGRYAVELPDGNAVLIFSFIGYKSQEIEVSNRNVVDVQLDADILTLSEVVVVGYGETQQKDISAAITTVKGSEMTNLKSAPSLDQMLQGQGTGIQVNQSSGAPGSPTRVLIRGLHSLSAASEPLWVIDGLPLNVSVGGIGNGQNPLATINPNDVESVQVLKDAAATAIYGSRGSNGVILITTKTGKKGKGQINLNYNYGVSDLVKSARDMGFVNSEQWIGLMDEGRRNVGLTTSITDPTVLPILPATIAGKDTLTAETISDTDWFDPLLRQGNFQEFNLSGSRGFEGGNMFLSANYRKDQGVLVNNSLERFTSRANLEFEPTKGLKTGIRLTLAYSNNKGVRDGGAPSGNVSVAGGGFSNAATAPPIFPIYNPNNESGYFNILAGSNPVISADKSLYRNEYSDYRALGGVYAEYKFPFLEGLSIRGEASADIDQGNRIIWYSRFIRNNAKPTAVPPTPATNYSEYTPILSRNLNYNLYTTLNKDIANELNVNWVLGTESQRFSASTANLFGEDIPGDQQDFGNPTTAYRYPSAYFLSGERYIKSYFTRANFKFKEKYLLGGSFRRDGVSIFTPENRWSNFYGVSAGWILSEEAFAQNLEFIDYLKLRASFGQTGNQGIPTTASTTTFNTGTSYANQPHSQLNVIGSPDITWETTNAYDAGIDANLFGDRIDISAGYYRQDVKGLLLFVPVPASVGAANNNIWANVGNIRNEGFELSLSGVAFRRGAFEWKTGVNITTNKSTVTYLQPELDRLGQGINTGSTNTVKGNRPGTFYMSQWAGIDPKTGMDMIYEVDRTLLSTTGKTVRTGNIIPGTNANYQNNKFFIDGKTGLPTYFGGFTNTFSFKGLELTAMFSFQGGNYIYGNSNTYQIGTGGGTFRDNLVGNTWTPENSGPARYSVLAWQNNYFIDNNGNPVLKADNTYAYATPLGSGQQSDRYLYKGDFMRLRTLQLAYNVPPALLQKMKLQALQINLTGNNIYTFTGYQGWDPEIVNISGNEQNRNLSQGFSSNTLPQVKTWTVGINLTL